ncbi:hypothetical protein y223_00037 [Bordetella phage PY223]
MARKKQDNNRTPIILPQNGGVWDGEKFICGPKLAALCADMRRKIEERALKGVRAK